MLFDLLVVLYLLAQRFSSSGATCTIHAHRHSTRGAGHNDVQHPPRVDRAASGLKPGHLLPDRDFETVTDVDAERRRVAATATESEPMKRFRVGSCSPRLVGSTSDFEHSQATENPRLLGKSAKARIPGVTRAGLLTGISSRGLSSIRLGAVGSSHGTFGAASELGRGTR